MGVLNIPDIQGNTTAESNDVNSIKNTIVAEINGNLDGNNIADGSITSSKLANTSFTNAKLSTTEGDLGGAWKDWTPTLTNMTLGNGSVVARYTQIGKNIKFIFIFTFGSTSSIHASNEPQFTVPVEMRDYGLFTDDLTSNAEFALNGAKRVAYDSSGNASSEATSFAVTPQNSTTVKLNNVNSTTPYTFATNDKIYATGNYEAA